MAPLLMFLRRLILLNSEKIDGLVRLNSFANDLYDNGNEGGIFVRSD